MHIFGRCIFWALYSLGVCTSECCTVPAPSSALYSSFRVHITPYHASFAIPVPAPAPVPVQVPVREQVVWGSPLEGLEDREEIV